MRLIMSVALAVGLLSAMGQDMETFLSAPITDEDYQISQFQIDYLNSHNFSSPWMRDLDFRIRTGHFNSIEEYRVRLGLINPLEIKANADYNKIHTENLLNKRLATINEIMQSRYELLVEHYFISRKIEINEQRLSALNNQRDLLLTLNGNFNDLLKIEEQFTKDQLNNIELEDQLAIINKLQPELSQIEWSNQQLITKEKALDKLNELSIAKFLSELSKSNYQLKTQEIKLRKAESFSGLGFIQSEYDVNRGDVLSDKIGFQVGVTIPVFNKDRPDLQRRQLNLIDDEVKFKNKNLEDSIKRSDVKAKLMICEKQMEFLEERKEQLASYFNALNQSNTDVDTYTRYTDYNFYIEEKLLETKCSFLNYYIKLIQLYGQLGNTTMINYLNDELPTFELGD